MSSSSAYKVNMNKFTPEDLQVFVDSMETIQQAEYLKNKSNSTIRKRHKTSIGFYGDISVHPQSNNETIISTIFEDNSLGIEEPPSKSQFGNYFYLNSSASSTTSLSSCIVSESSSGDLPPLQRPRTYAFSGSNSNKIGSLKRKASNDNHMIYLTTMCRSISPIPSSDDGYSSTHECLTPVEDCLLPSTRPRSYAVTNNTNGRMTRARIIGTILKREYAEAGSQNDLEVALRSERVVGTMKQDISLYKKYGQTGIGGVDPKVLEKSLSYLTL